MSKEFFNLKEQIWESSLLKGRPWYAAHCHEREMNGSWAIPVHGVSNLTHSNVCISAVLLLVYPLLAVGCCVVPPPI